MKNSFSLEEKRKYSFKKYLKEHFWEYILDFICPLLLTIFILYLCKAEKFIYGIIISIAYSIGKTTYNIYHYKKEYIDVDIK